MADLGVEPYKFRRGKRVNERQRMPHGGKEDIAARLVRFGFNGKPDVVTGIDDVLAQQVYRFPVTIQRGADVLGGVVFGAFPPAPHDESLCAEFGREIDVAEHLTEREPADLAVVGGEAAVFEYGRGEQVRRHHWHDDSGCFQCTFEPVDLFLPFRIGGTESKKIIVMKRHTVGAKFVQLLHGVDHVEIWSSWPAERVTSAITDGP